MSEQVTVLLPHPATENTHTPTRGRRWPDGLLAGLVLAFAFLAGSVPARNSDLWLHLAAGRAVARGEAAWGVDPFSYTTAGARWVNHAWLTDLALYAGYESLGGAALVALKALGVAALAGLMLLLGRRGAAGPFWVCAGCVLLALVAMSPRLLLQPACLSLGLLAVTLLLLRTGGRALPAVPLVIALWVNLDAWFLLGPLVVALVLVGQVLAGRDGDPGEPGYPWWLLPASLLACLASPYHVHALRLPAELSPGVWASGLPQDPRFAPFFASPWRLAPLLPAGGVSLAAWAYLLLVALGLLSFLTCRPALASWRLAVWLPFALLAAWQARLVPFFAVVAGPITALNLGDGLFRQARAGWGRAAVLLASLALLALAWPGWLNGFYRSERGVGWAVRADPSLRRAAATLTRWRAEGRLPPGTRTFATHPDAAHHFAWFAPGEPAFLDSRWPLFLPVAGDYLRIGRELGFAATGDTAGDEAGPPGLSPESLRALRDHGVACLVLYDPSVRRLGPALDPVAAGQGPLRLLTVDGQAVLAGLQPPPAGANLPPFDPRHAAFGPAAAPSRGPDGSPPAAAGRGPALRAEAATWWEDYLGNPGPGPWQTEAASLMLHLADRAAARAAARDGGHDEAGRAARATGLPLALTPGGLPAATLPVWLAREEVRKAAASPEALAWRLLAVRAAREAVAEQPADAPAWQALGSAYAALARTPPESPAHASPGGPGGPGATVAPLADLRAIQTATALVQAVNRQPNSQAALAAHAALAGFFAERGYLDLALRHLDASRDLARRAPARTWRGGQSAFDARLDAQEQSTDSLREAVQTAENRYAIHAEGMSANPLGRARLALEQGLAGKALDDVLLRSHPDLYGVEGLRLLLQLLLRTGRAAEARVLLDRAELRDNPMALGPLDLAAVGPDGRPWTYRFVAYDWFDACQAAAAGNTDDARAALERLRRRLEAEERQLATRLAPVLAGQVAAEVGLAAGPTGLGGRILVAGERDRAAGLVAQGRLLPVERADLHVVDGLLALEAGRADAAAADFEAALKLYGRLPPPEAAEPARRLPGPGAAGQALAGEYLGWIRKATPAEPEKSGP